MYRYLALICLPCVLASSLILDPIQYDTYDMPSRTCEPIAVDMCRENGYNFTGGPNFLQEESYTQKDSMLQLDTFRPLIRSGCSKQLQAFLCTAYVPMCDPQVEQLIGPCRSVCENVKMRCQPILKQVGLLWPAALNCSVFPASNTAQHMCMEFPSEDAPVTSTVATTQRIYLPQNTGKPPCLSKKIPAAYKLVNATGMCQVKCTEDVTFTEKQKHFSEIWVAIWTSFSLLFSLLTVMTFLIDTSQFPYPKRPIIFLSLSYTMYTVGYLVRLVAGRQLVLCDSDGLITQGLDNTNCTAVFLLLYYFSTAAALWWVILSLTWLLSAGFKWSHEAIDLYSSYFHLVAWGVPSIQSITVIVLRDISGDELTGLCFISSTNPNSLLGFVIGPMAAYLFLGTGFLVAGYIVSFCHDKKDSTKKSSESTEELMVRIGIFSLFYSVPTTCLLACYFYEYLNSASWDSALSPNTPSIEIFSLKMFCCLLPGVTSGLCVLSCRNFDTWSTVCGKPCLKRYPNSSKGFYHCGSSSINSNSNSNNNNNHARPYLPVKPIAVCRGDSTPSQYLSKSGSRSHSDQSTHHFYRMSPVRSPPNVHPEEYHV